MSSLDYLEPSMLNDSKKLKEISFWCSVMNRPQGWHYDLDFIWVLNLIELKNLKKNSKILDAGAGLGPFQYILASKGYQVFSLDFSKRKIPENVRRIFKVSEEEHDTKYEHPYQNFITFKNKEAFLKKIFKLIKLSLIDLFLYLFFKIKKNLIYYLNSLNLSLFFKKNNFGSITFIKAPFHEIPYQDNYFDMVISISALEHSDKSLIEKSIDEMKRVLNPDGNLLITTSSSMKVAETFHKESSGWCFSQETISKILGRNVFNDETFLKRIEKKFLESKKWKSRIDPYYLLNEQSNFYRKKIESLPYLPIAFNLKK